MKSSPPVPQYWLNQDTQTLLQVVALASPEDVVAENWRILQPRRTIVRPEWRRGCVECNVHRSALSQKRQGVPTVPAFAPIGTIRRTSLDQAAE